MLFLCLFLIKDIFGPRTGNISNEFTHCTFSLETVSFGESQIVIQVIVNDGSLRLRFGPSRVETRVAYCGRRGRALLAPVRQD